MLNLENLGWITVVVPAGLDNDGVIISWPVSGLHEVTLWNFQLTDSSRVRLGRV